MTNKEEKLNKILELHKHAKEMVNDLKTIYQDLDNIDTVSPEEKEATILKVSAIAGLGFMTLFMIAEEVSRVSAEYINEDSKETEDDKLSNISIGKDGINEN